MEGQPIILITRVQNNEETLIAVAANDAQMRRARLEDFVRCLREAFPSGADDSNQDQHQRFSESIAYKLEIAEGS